MTYEIISKRTIKNIYTVTEPKEIFKLLKRYGNNRQEGLYTITIDSRSNVIGVYITSIGTATTAPAHPRDIFYNAIMDNAYAFIIAHNHPTGNLLPTDEDIGVTVQMIEAGKIMGIKLIDHIIFRGDYFLSIRQDKPSLFSDKEKK